MEKSLTDVSPPHSHYEHSLPPGASLNAEVTNKNALESSNTVSSLALLNINFVRRFSMS